MKKFSLSILAIIFSATLFAQQIVTPITDLGIEFGQTYDEVCEILDRKGIDYSGITNAQKTYGIRFLNKSYYFGESNYAICPSLSFNNDTDLLCRITFSKYEYHDYVDANFNARFSEEKKEKIAILASGFTDWINYYSYAPYLNEGGVIKSKENCTTSFTWKMPSGERVWVSFGKDGCHSLNIYAELVFTHRSYYP